MLIRQIDTLRNNHLCFFSSFFLFLYILFDIEAAEKREENITLSSFIFLLDRVIRGLYGTFSRNFATWIDEVVPRWMVHVYQNLIIDLHLYLRHV